MRVSVDETRADHPVFGIDRLPGEARFYPRGDPEDPAAGDAEVGAVAGSAAAVDDAAVPDD